MDNYLISNQVLVEMNAPTVSIFSYDTVIDPGTLFTEGI